MTPDELDGVPGLIARLRETEAERDRLREVRVDLLGTLGRIADRDESSREEEAAARGVDGVSDLVCLGCDAVEIAVAAIVRHGEDGDSGEVRRLREENARLRDPFSWTVTWHLGDGTAVDLGGHGDLVGLDAGEGQVILTHPDVGEGAPRRTPA